MTLSILNVKTWVGLHKFASSAMMLKVIDLIVDLRVIKSCKVWLKASDTQILTYAIHITLLIIV
jgi:hypothetical protein